MPFVFALSMFCCAAVDKIIIKWQTIEEGSNLVIVFNRYMVSKKLFEALRKPAAIIQKKASSKHEVIFQRKCGEQVIKTN